MNSTSDNYKSTFNAVSNFYKTSNIDNLFFPTYVRDNKLVDEYNSYATTGHLKKYSINNKIYMRKNGVRVINMKLTRQK